MITFFTTLEQFLYREKNSLLSWTKLDCVHEIVVYTSLETSQILEHPKVVARKYPKELKPLDPPSIKDLFLDAIDKTDNQYLCYVNSDIIFLSDFCETFKHIKDKYDKPFQMVGKRRDWVDYCDLDINNLSDEQIMEIAGDLPFRNTEHCDYFCFHKDVYLNLNSKNFFPNFLIARGSFDRCMLWLPRQIGYDSIDCSENIYALHHEEGGDVRGPYKSSRPSFWPQFRENERLLVEAMRKFNQSTHVIPNFPGVNVKAPL
jgi:hypothetical protein